MLDGQWTTRIRGELSTELAPPIQPNSVPTTDTNETISPG
jgi:hypothetical protein